VNIRLLIASKEFSTAQDILHDYFKVKNGFLSDTSNICSKEELDTLDSVKKERQIYLISGKLRLISTLANLMHELIRNSVDMFEILISHTEKIYGIDSLELSNCYFYTANYLNFLIQNTKALACFLKCAKIRKHRGGTAYYNVALLLLRANRKKKALEYFQKALELIEQEKNQDNSYVIP
jgi:tetratricopeptide (TPR) repeat protein